MLPERFSQMSSTEEFAAFELVRRGYDPAAVEQRLQQEAAARRELEVRIHQLEQDIKSARDAEEAVKLTFLAATRTKDELVEGAQEAANKILSEAKYEAYKVLTDAKAEADQITSEARAEADHAVTRARAEAETSVADARREAFTIVSSIKDETERLIAEQKMAADQIAQDAEEENRELLDKVVKLRAVARDIEARLHAVAVGAIDDILATTSLIESQISANGELAGLIAQRRLVALPGRDRVEEHSDAPQTPTNGEEDHEVPAGRRQSFYSRRSAGLPRIGQGQGSAILAKMAELRAENGEAVDRNDVAQEEAAELSTVVAAT